MAARVLLGLAVLIGVLGIMLSEWISLKPWRHVLGVGILAFVILGLLAWRLDVWAVGKAKMDAATLPPPAAPPPPVPPTIAFVKPESKTAKGLIVTGNTNTTGNTVTQGAGSIAQIGGSNNQATITNNWAPPERILNPQDRNELVTQLSKRKARAAVRCVFSDKEAVILRASSTMC
jgi:hypothetical protein